mgnify:CR=1 FL=1
MEEEIIQPIDKKILKEELTSEKQLRTTNKSHNEIYIVTSNDSPNVFSSIIVFIGLFIIVIGRLKSNIGIYYGQKCITGSIAKSGFS